ncbi:MAG: hypothetical protein IKI64_05250 [Clostridia bacterium]|nr:hypothetical protein [Clostridia bacterium]
MKRTALKILIPFFLAAALLLTACSGLNTPVIVEITSFTAIPVSTFAAVNADVRFETLAPAATPAPFNVSPTPYVPPTPTPVTTPTPEPTAVPTAVPTASQSDPSPTNEAVPTYVPVPTMPWFTPLPGGLPDQRVFDSCAFVGNSMFEALHAYGVVTHGAFFTTVGLNINTVYTAATTHGSIPVIDELNTGSYVGVLLMFGQNELGWPDANVFIQKYAKLIRDVKQRQPNARVFITGMPPITKALSDQGKDGVTNENINYINALLANLANEFGYCRYITVPDSMYDANDALPAGASGDGLHLNMTYSRIWSDHICLAVAAGLWS